MAGEAHPVPPRPDHGFRRSETYADSCMVSAGYWDGLSDGLTVITAGQGVDRGTSLDPVPPRPTPSRTGWGTPPNVTPSRPPLPTGGRGRGGCRLTDSNKISKSELNPDGVADTRRPR